MTARDRRPATVTLQIDDHPDDARPYVLNDIADRLRVPRADVLDVLKNWTHGELVAHLERFSSAELRPPAFRAAIPPSGSPPRVIVADPAERYRTALCAGLGAVGFNVVAQAGSWAEVKAVGAVSADIIVIEPWMPHEDHQAVQNLCSANPNAAVIYLGPMEIESFPDPLRSAAHATLSLEKTSSPEQLAAEIARYSREAPSP